MTTADIGDVDMGRGLDTTPIPLLEQIRSQGRVWEDLAAQYGVTNPDPPWKVNLEGICDALSAEACALPVLERRYEEDELSEDLYADVPYPERQLLALAHSLIRRGVVDEAELETRMKQVHERLTRI
ncbi:MAG: nitrile hydratase subunit beta [Sedimenticolaceae bacterium]